MSTDDEITRDSLPKFQKSSQNEKRKASVDPLIRAVEIGKRFLVEGHPPPICHQSPVPENQVNTRKRRRLTKTLLRVSKLEAVETFYYQLMKK